MAAKKRRTPQEKKSLSYAKDRRDNYGEHSKGSRKAIPLNKTLGRRAVRRAGSGDWLEDPDTALVAVEQASRKRFRKASHLPLGEMVELKARRRGERIGARQIRKAEMRRMCEKCGVPSVGKRYPAGPGAEPRSDAEEMS